MAVEPKIAIERILADLNLAVRYGIAMRIYASRKFWRIFNLAVVIIDRQTAKFNSPPNFPAIRYMENVTPSCRLRLRFLSCIFMISLYSWFRHTRMFPWTVWVLIDRYFDIDYEYESLKP